MRLGKPLILSGLIAFSAARAGAADQPTTDIFAPSPTTMPSTAPSSVGPATIPDTMPAMAPDTMPTSMAIPATLPTTEASSQPSAEDLLQQMLAPAPVVAKPVVESPAPLASSTNASGAQAAVAENLPKVRLAT